MDTDDLDPPRPTQDPKNLEVLSIDALEEYIAQLRAEIARVEVEIERKKQARAGADAVFKF